MRRSFGMRAAALGSWLAFALAMGGTGGCGFVAADGEDGDDGGSCSITATCEPEGLLIFLSWDDAAASSWPATPVDIRVLHPDADAAVVVECTEGIGGSTSQLPQCAPRCADGPGQQLVDGRCHLPLPLPLPGDDRLGAESGDESGDETGDETGDEMDETAELGEPLARHLEVWMETRQGRPVVRAVEVMDHERRRARLYPRDLGLAFDDGVSTWSWTFAPPHVHIDASTSGTFACPYEVCDGLFVSVEVSALGPVT